ncbi:head-tail connector protein [Anaerorhabdus sp.]|uniref:head-tail connector protein n=1 Tax=Anaerorhabdus sp. TaxID=1872524 RepID=UPI002B1EFD4A|nr:head-tail connector protein [Anaerorhabdus sp.]MEA4876022.1 head-tail connector protein [Anaerorhabdus sp.]
MENTTQKDSLLEEVKLYLRVDVSDFDNEINGFIQSSIVYFKNKISSNFDENKDFEKSILKDRVRYQFNRAINEFEYDFISELLNLEELYEEKN